MGVKSTISLSREQAIQKYVDLMMAGVNLREVFLADAAAMTNRALEDRLEALNDAAHEGEGFENYNVYGICIPDELENIQAMEKLNESLFGIGLVDQDGYHAQHLSLFKRKQELAK